MRGLPRLEGRRERQQRHCTSVQPKEMSSGRKGCHIYIYGSVGMEMDLICHMAIYIYMVFRSGPYSRERSKHTYGYHIHGRGTPQGSRGTAQGSRGTPQGSRGTAQGSRGTTLQTHIRIPHTHTAYV